MTLTEVCERYSLPRRLIYPMKQISVEQKIVNGYIVGETVFELDNGTFRAVWTCGEWRAWRDSRTVEEAREEIRKLFDLTHPPAV